MAFYRGLLIGLAVMTPIWLAVAVVAFRVSR